MSIARFTTVLLSCVALAGCEGASEPELNVPDPTLDELQESSVQNDNPFLGAWRLTSAVLGDDELLLGRDFSYVMTFWSDGKHSVSVSGDVDHLVCGTETSCAWGGTYTYTGTTFTTVEPDHPDPGEQGEDTGFYAFCGNKLIVVDEGDGAGIRLTLERTRQDCYARGCE